MRVMRVLRVIGAMDRGGAESLLMNIYRNIDRDKLQFDFLVHEAKDCDFDKEIKRLGGGIFHIPRFVGLNPFAYARHCRDFFFQNNDYVAVHVHIGSSAAIVIREAKRYGLYCIAHSHNTNPPLSPFELAFRFFSYPTRKLADYFFACSRQAGIDRYGIEVVEGPNFAVLNNGIELSRYQFDLDSRVSYRDSLGLSSSELAVCHVGRFASQKNHHFLIESFSLFVKENRCAKLFLIGRGPLEPEIEKQAADLGIRDKVVFLGVRDDVPKLLMAMDVFVFPSSYGGLGIAAIEAQATGLPSLLSPELPSMAFYSPYAIRINGLKDPVSLKDQIALVSPRAAELRVDGVEYAKDGGFDIVETAKRLSEFYEQVGGKA